LFEALSLIEKPRSSLSGVQSCYEVDVYAAESDT